MGAVVRRPPDTLFRSTADGFLLHTRAGILEVRGLDAELWNDLVGEVSVGLLVDMQAAGDTDSPGSTVASEVLTALAHLHQREALEVVGG
jgi:hypothetical protein